MQSRAIVSGILLLFTATAIGFIIGVNFPRDRDSEPEVTIPGFEVITVIITATPNPFATPVIPTAFPTQRSGQVSLPPGVLPSRTPTTPPTEVLATITIAVVPPQSTQPPNTQVATIDDSSAPSSGECPVHTIGAGDVLAVIAQTYGVALSDLMIVNGMTEIDARFLQLGQEIIVPAEGCVIEGFNDVSASEPPETLTAQDLLTINIPTETPAVSPTPTLTLPPTAEAAQIVIADVINPGDVTTEGIRIRNQGNSLDLSGWTISDEGENTFTLQDDIVLFEDAELTIYTRSGENTATELYWNLDRPLWESGDVITLRDANGDVQSTFRISN